MKLKQRVPLAALVVLADGGGKRNITKTGQIGDGREAAVVDYVLANARQGDIDDALATIDRFAYEKSFLINVGDEKGELLDAAVRRARPSAGAGAGHLLRVRRAAHRARPRPARSRLRSSWPRPTRVTPVASGRTQASRDRITCVVGTIGDGGRTLDALGARTRLRLRRAGFRVPRSRQERVSGRSDEHRRSRLACTAARSSSPTT